MIWPPRPLPDGGRNGDEIVVALINNMSPRSMRTTEQQFRDLLDAAAGDSAVRLRLFTIHEDRRIGPAQTAERDAYQSLEALWQTRPDGMIVTGMEPTAGKLSDEPAWMNLTKLINWATFRGIPTVWSCLAAHAAVLYLDDVDRVPLPRKLSGLFSCTLAVPDHPLAAGFPTRWLCPHSRHNGLPEDALRARGYEIISASDEAGVDMFIRDHGAPFLFCQGHPEYGPDVLMREYIRDLKRYLDGERDAPADVPARYVDAGTESRLRAIRESAPRLQGTDVLARTQEVARSAVYIAGWRPVAVEVYRNWLALIAAHRREMAA
ncbi:MAG TPA: homoserine O-succinyltransferase [Acetobacteraceae bacterium]|nr:homoserine O-succinyltransferase [Acetobacteraceae bacterium]